MQTVNDTQLENYICVCSSCHSEFVLKAQLGTGRNNQIFICLITVFYDQQSSRCMTYIEKQCCCCLFGEFWINRFMWYENLMNVGGQLRNTNDSVFHPYLCLRHPQQIHPVLEFPGNAPSVNSFVSKLDLFLHQWKTLDVYKRLDWNTNQHSKSGYSDTQLVIY